MSGNKQNLPEFYEKFFIKLFFFFAAFTLLGFSAFGQNKKQTASNTTADYRKIIDEAYKKLETVSYRLQSRLKLSIGGFSGADVDKTYEFVPPDKSKKTATTSYWTDTGDTDPEKTEQIIEFEKKRYIKFNDENWKEISAADEQKLKYSEDAYFLGMKDYSSATDLLIKQSAAVVPDKQTRIYRATYQIDRRSYEVFYYITAKGFLIKTEWDVRSKGFQVIMTEIYDYDADIKIEAPKLNQ